MRSRHGKGRKDLMLLPQSGDGLQLLAARVWWLQDQAEGGSDIRTVQELLGYSDVATTMIYRHVLMVGGMGLCSPLDRMLQASPGHGSLDGE